MDNKLVNEMVKAAGSLAELSLVFFRASIDAGATAKEATMLTQAFMASIIHGNQDKE